ncbi:MAG: MerR family transcriptional regulator [Phenylobacterium sp.]|uniref:MerR family transcriptional regulator n=1 Tax=Phenylobacterium sp. TaxID=1871053 RepID=UPI0039194591
MRNGWSIGELARGAGVAVETVRYYERIGLLPAPPRTQGNYRAYEPAHAARLAFIRRSRDLGFSVDQIRALLGLADGTDRDCAEADAIARERLADVERKIADLTAMKDELHDLIDHCGRSTVRDCRILRSLAGRDGA